MSGEAPQVLREVQITIDTVDAAIHQAPVIFLDGAEMMVTSPQIAKFNLYQDRITSSGAGAAGKPVERVVCARLVMTRETLHQLSTWLHNSIQSLQASPGADQK
jgi:hypothetical protein